MEDNRNTNNNLEYTIVMDGSYLNDAEKKDEALWQAVQRQEKEPEDHVTELDRLYYDYERMCLQEPNFLDKDDIYPHSYQWRLDKYDPEKVQVLKEALRLHRHIADTEAYSKFIDAISSRKFTPQSWD